MGLFDIFKKKKRNHEVAQQPIDNNFDKDIEEPSVTHRISSSGFGDEQEEVKEHDYTCRLDYKKPEQKQKDSDYTCRLDYKKPEQKQKDPNYTCRLDYKKPKQESDENGVTHRLSSSGFGDEPESGRNR